MIRYLLLGFLRDGQPRHGYALMKEAKGRLRVLANSGSFYRELRMLERAGLVTVREDSTVEDARRTSYVITEEGRRVFLAWLRSPVPELRSAEDDLAARALFFRDTGESESDQMLQRWQDRLWLECKILERERDELIAGCAAGSGASIQELLLTRRIARTVADIDFLAALGRCVTHAAATPLPIAGAPAASPAPTPASSSPRPRKALG